MFVDWMGVGNERRVQDQMKAKIAAVACLCLLGASHAIAQTNVIGVSQPKLATGLVAPAGLKDCPWSARFVQSLVKNSKGRVVEMDATAYDAARNKIDVTFIKLDAPEREGMGKRRLGVRVSFFSEGRLLVVKDLEDRTAVGGKPVCDIISNLAFNLGDDVSGFIDEGRVPVCDAACTGQNPEKPIALGKEVLLAANVPSDALRTCPWLKEGIADLEENVNGDDERVSYINLFKTDQDILKYSGRKLVITVLNIQLTSIGNVPAWIEMKAELIDGGMVAASLHGKETTSFNSAPCKQLSRMGGRFIDKAEAWLVVGPELNVEAK